MNPTSKPCPQCQVLVARVAALEAQVQLLLEQLAAAKKSSATSSKPPSSDIVKPKPPAPPEGQQRSIGGQPGHPMHSRDPFPVEQITGFFTHSLDACPDCGGAVRPNGTIERVTQQVDIAEVPLTVEQHTRPELWCDHCQKPCLAPLPLGIERGGLVGPNLPP